MCSCAYSTLYYISGIVIPHYKGRTVDRWKTELADKFVNYGTEEIQDYPTLVKIHEPAYRVVGMNGIFVHSLTTPQAIMNTIING